MSDDLGIALAELAEGNFRETLVKGAQIHGGLWQQVETLSPAQATWRPAAERHCIWEIMRHIVFWRRYLFAWYARTERPDPSGSWAPLPDPPGDASWAADLAALEETQRDLDHVLRGIQAADLLQPNRDGRYGRFVYLVGLLTHDSYHAGQIAVLRALQGLPPIV